MAEFLSPGVFIREVLSGQRPMDGIGTTAFGVVGAAQRGLVNNAILVTNFGEFQDQFGDFIASSFMAYDVFMYFLNGGTRCFVVRVTGSGAAIADVDLYNSASSALLEYNVTAQSQGLWGNDITFVLTSENKLVTTVAANAAEDAVSVTLSSVSGLRIGSLVRMVITGSSPISYHTVKVTNIVSNTIYFADADALPAGIDEDNEAVSIEFGLAISYRGVLKETFHGLSTESENVIDYVETVLRTKSNYLRWDKTGVATDYLEKQPAAGTYTLASGLDGSAPSTANLIGEEDEGSGLYALDSVSGELLSIAVPDDQTQVMTQAGLAYCELRKTRFYIATTANGLTAQEAKTFVETTAAYNSSYGAVYWPHIRIFDPRSNGLLTIPPTGAVAGVFARTDSTRGVAKSPAGIIDGRLLGVLDLETPNGQGLRDLIYPARINPIKKDPGTGVVVWGARTLSANTELRYVSNRRYLTYLAMILEKGLQWAVHENNESSTYVSMRRNIGSLLLEQWRQGLLRGRTAQEAFYVICDETTNPPSQIEQGILRARVGVALQKPAEFVVIEIQQDLRALQAELAAAGISL